MNTRHWDNDLSIPDLLKLEPAPPSISLTFVRSGLDGRVTGYAEVRTYYSMWILSVESFGITRHPRHEARLD